MKKNILILSSALLFNASVFMIGCKKDDTTAPVVTLNGASAQTISLQGSYTDMGATANDDQDGAITPVSSGSVNVNQTGVYTITYTATDAAGNEGSADRTITVVNDAAYLIGSYTVTEDTVWTQTVSVSQIENNVIGFSKFANYSNNTNITAKVTGSNIALIGATVSGIGASGCTHTFSPNSSTTVAITQVSGKYRFKIGFFDQRIAGGSSCSAIASTPYVDEFVQQ